MRLPRSDSKAMLGPAQIAWVMRSLDNSQAIFVPAFSHSLSEGRHGRYTGGL